MSMCTKGWLVIALTFPACADENADQFARAPSRASLWEEGSLRYQARELPRSLPEYPALEVVGLTPEKGVIAFAQGCDQTTGWCTADALNLTLDGDYSVLAADFRPFDVNRRGDVAGCFLDRVDNQQQFGQAAIIHGDGTVERFPRGPSGGTCILRLSDGGTALVVSQLLLPDANLEDTYYVDVDGETFAVPVGMAEHAVDINDRGELAITLFPFDATRRAAFRFDARSQVSTKLAEATPDLVPRAFAINQRGDVLGDLLVTPSRELIGYWDEAGEFKTVSSADDTASASWLTWNEGGLIIASYGEGGRTCVLPRPGVRLDLATLVDDCNVPSGLAAWDVDENGDFLAQQSPLGTYHLFLREE